MNRRFYFLKHRFNLSYCYLFRRHSINGGNVIMVETLFQIFEAALFFRRRGDTTSGREANYRLR
ncbi:hypothetical protein EHJ07_10765 [Cronobacter muytjensii]|nr:hypothetical protein [Cronobacter muytjensii]